MFACFLYCNRQVHRDFLITLHTGLNVKYPLFLSDFNKLEFLRHIFEKSSDINFDKIHPVGAQFFHADGQTDKHDEANSRFSQNCEKRLKRYLQEIGRVGVDWLNRAQDMKKLRAIVKCSHEPSGSIKCGECPG